MNDDRNSEIPSAAEQIAEIRAYSTPELWDILTRNEKFVFLPIERFPHYEIEILEYEYWVSIIKSELAARGEFN